MDSVKKKFLESAMSLPVDKDGMPNPQDCARLQFDAFANWWIDWVFILDPHNRRAQFGLTFERIFGSEIGQPSLGETMESKDLLRRKLGVKKLSIGTFLKIRGIIREAIEKAKSWSDVDVALSAFMAFVRLELGGELEPEYGNFPQPKVPPFKLNDEDLPEDEFEAGLELELRYENWEDFGTSDYYRLMYFKQWRDTFESDSEFEKAFPGAGHRRLNALKAAAPIFEHLDSVWDVEVLKMFVDWVSVLLKHPLNETRFPLRKDTSKAAA